MRVRLVSPLVLSVAWPLVLLLVLLLVMPQAPSFAVATTPLPAPPPSIRRRPSRPRNVGPRIGFTLNLTAWKTSLKRAKTDERRDEILSALNLKLDLTDSEGSDGPDGHGPRAIQVTLMGIDDALVHLSPGDFPEHVVQVRYRLETAEDKSTAYLIQVLRPSGDGGWCFLGTDLSRQDDGETHLDAYTLGFVPLLASRTRGIEVQMVGAGLRHSDVTRQYWIADGLKLRKIFDQKIDSMDNVEDGREPTVKSGKLALTGSFPKRIELRQITKHAICDAHSGDTSCDGNEQTSTTIFVYDGKTYVRRK